MSDLVSTGVLSKFVQVRNPKTDRYTKIDRGTGQVVSTKKTAEPYKGIPIIRPKLTRRQIRKAVREVKSKRAWPVGVRRWNDLMFLRNDKNASTARIDAAFVKLMNRKPSPQEFDHYFSRVKLTVRMFYHAVNGTFVDG